jgi:hypothetical protein
LIRWDVYTRWYERHPYAGVILVPARCCQVLGLKRPVSHWVKRQYQQPQHMVDMLVPVRLSNQQTLACTKGWQAKGVPPRRQKGTQADGPTNALSFWRAKPIRSAHVLRRDSDRVDSLSLSLFLLIATITRPDPAPWACHYLPYLPLHTRPSVLCRRCFLLFLAVAAIPPQLIPFFTSLLQPTIGDIAPSTPKATRCLFCLHL